MSRGLLYVVYGREYERLAAATIEYSRRYTDLPIHVVINQELVQSGWKAIPNISFDHHPNVHQNHNRMVKTSMNIYSPFDETIYLDCDSVVQKEGIEYIFELLKDNDLVLNPLLRWFVGDKILRLYKKALIMSKVELPLVVYNGAIIGWKKGQRTLNFFNDWNKLWVALGKGREMHALSCVVKKRGMRVGELPSSFFSPDTPNEDSVVQHNYNSYKGKDFFDEFGLPHIKQNHSFDSDPKDWNWVTMEAKQ